ncbi:uncharacterized protein BDZ99DRAFT_166686 [Mytilinidion resinicola]|uniref:Secreted protein n=1 Tax=Mytilinidion resinicola TaxID=574789 RepID=A0A6A6Y433_9PEZI|nr:uncharacterized protein BDZ99DRAFT_166686 [Mytilinidion resinicola]KAF2803542.1 hypothetical protein BDZ99DRAFT_166686 [Mytilinidion resinicola]
MRPRHDTLLFMVLTLLLGGRRLNSFSSNNDISAFSVEVLIELTVSFLSCSVCCSISSFFEHSLVPLLVTPGYQHPLSSSPKTRMLRLSGLLPLLCPKSPPTERSFPFRRSYNPQAVIPSSAHPLSSSLFASLQKQFGCGTHATYLLPCLLYSPSRSSHRHRSYSASSCKCCSSFTKASLLRLVKPFHGSILPNGCPLRIATRRVTYLSWSIGISNNESICATPFAVQ